MFTNKRWTGTGVHEEGTARDKAAAFVLEDPYRRLRFALKTQTFPIEINRVFQNILQRKLTERKEQGDSFALYIDYVL